MFTNNKSASNLAQGSNEFIQTFVFMTACLDIWWFITLIGKRPHELPDQIVKELFSLLNFLWSYWPPDELFGLSEEGVFYALPGVCQSLFFDEETNSSQTARFLKSVNCLTNQGFYTLFTAGNAWRPRQRMRTLRIRCRFGKAFFQ